MARLFSLSYWGCTSPFCSSRSCRALYVDDSCDNRVYRFPILVRVA
jgi:hypothetical protein